LTLGPSGLGEFDGARWRSLGMPATPVRGPIAFDERRGRLVVFDETRTAEWDGARWWFPTPVPAPASRENAAVAYDPVLQRCVLYGGSVSASASAECWSWDGTTWTLLAA